MLRGVYPEPIRFAQGKLCERAQHDSVHSYQDTDRLQQHNEMRSPLRGGFPGAADALDDIDHVLDFFRSRGVLRVHGSATGAPRPSEERPIPKRNVPTLEQPVKEDFDGALYVKL